ncbi:hypothetical protein [Streptomyces sp. 2P-4]|uniref:hypothetical protein n=1 Tax=Streptomyces sp. 2P-4 TaxID=2931974 RepID=UPI002540669B|nr:hypothetical protein [Streptomyces sp. 2P-4]
MGTGHFYRDGNTHLAVSPADLVQFIRGLSDDPEAYATLYKAESRYAGLVMEGIPQGATGAKLEVPLDKLGSAIGAYNSVMEDVINDKRTAEYSAADYKSKVAYHIIGGALTPLYFTVGGVSVAVGDSLQRGVDMWTWQWANEMKAAADAEANKEIVNRYLSANTQVPILVEDWAKDRPDLGDSQTEELTRKVLHGQHLGTDTAHKYLTDTTN